MTHVNLNDDCLSDIDIRICETQASIFELIALHNYDLFAFAKKYMQSNFTKRQMDTLYSRYQFHDAEECLDFIFPEIGIPEKVEKPTLSEIAYWIGYMYRALYLVTKVPSTRLIQLLSIEEMFSLYTGFHTMDEIMQLERLIEIMNTKEFYYENSEGSIE